VHVSCVSGIYHLLLVLVVRVRAVGQTGLDVIDVPGTIQLELKVDPCTSIAMELAST
jgi:hypothetical protein